MNIFRENCYRRIIKGVVSERKRLDSSINFQQMAAFIRVPKSYISRVMKEQADFNSDQLSLVCEYLDFSEKEVTYLFLLMEHARSGLKKRKDSLLQKIKSIQDEQLESKSHLSANPVSIADDLLSAYYLDPMVQIVHICLAVPMFQNDLNLLSSRLKLRTPELETILQKLEKMKILIRHNGKVELLEDNMHLPRESPLYRSWRNQLKLLSMNKVDRLSEDDYCSFSVVFSGDEKTKKEIQHRFLEFLKGVESLVGKADQEGAYQMSFELFPWT